MTIEPDDPLWDMAQCVRQRERGEQEDLPLSLSLSLSLPPPPPPSGDPTTPECAHCGGGQVVVHDGYWVCAGCSSIFGRQLDYGPEWRYYGAEDMGRMCNPTRCCPPSNGLITSLGSVVSNAPRRSVSSWANRTLASAASAANTLSGGRSVQRCQVWSSFTYRERVLCGVFDQLAVNAATHGLPACILEEAKNLYKRVSDGRITRGANRAAVIAVSMYVACKKCGVPRSHKEIAAMFDMKPAQLTKACRMFHTVVQDADDVSSAPSDFVGRFCSHLGMPDDGTELVRAVVARADELGIVCDVMPPSVVAGSVFLVCRELGLTLGTKETIASACVVAPVTVVKIYKRLEPYKSHLLN